ncbi:hypothetical protein F503_02562 [Ophiostoma piceae UAMH 11346]|uniref:Uncharacterized protein n=1 Tax=Ophiostoma piceae (strain UAMH 11346) TaxID=1262450 RepID=S3BYT4_OPHP1|nr:hypothetical protein F503_02562 [Ophiostoma piceae UAMH 11346]
MVDAVPDAAQTKLPAMTNGHNGYNGHRGHALSGFHGDRSSSAATIDGDAATRPDKGKEPEHSPHAMEIEPHTTPADSTLAFRSLRQNGGQDSEFGMSPEDVSHMMASMDDPANEDWDAIEENWHAQMSETQAKEDKDLLAAYRSEESVVVEELEEAIAVHNRLLEDLFQARVLVDGKVDTLQCLLAAYEEKQKAIEDGRDANNLRVRSWISNGRKVAAETLRIAASNRHNNHLAYDDDQAGNLHRADSASPFHHRLRGAIEHDDQQMASRSSSSRRREAPQPPSASSSQEPNAVRPPPLSQTWDAMDIDFEPQMITDVMSANGIKIGRLRSIPLVNHWIDSLMQFPVLRTVEIRLGRKFTLAHLEAVYEGPDLKKSKWLSFMIQATGQVQDRACQTCAKGQGLFSLCIIVGGPDFPRCGNCEWNKHGCHGAAGPTNSVLPDFHGQARSQHRPRPEVVERNKINKAALPLKPHINYKKSVAHYTKAMNLEEPPPKPASKSLPDDDNEDSSRSPTSGRKRGKAPKTAKPGSTSTRGGRRQKSTGASTPGTNRPSTPAASGNAEESFVKAMTPFDATEVITEYTLSLRHDGMIYLEPELMRGVPRRKISPEHAYWDPSWRSLENYVTNKYDEWVSKLTGLKAIPEANLTDKDRTAIFQAGRQINRGTAILKYLAKCDLHPYQLVAKSFMTPSFTHYDTLFRMVATIDELGKFKLSVSPVDWLRQRLHEIHREKGDAFKLDRVIAKLYHDPKLSYLRSKNGFGNIGRPSVHTKGGVGGVEGSGGDGTGTSPGTKRRSEKRRDLRDSAASTPTRRGYTDAEKQAARDLAPRSKRQKTVASPAATSAALAPASVTAPTQASRPVIAPQAPKNSSRSQALAALASRILSTSPGPSASNASDQGSPLSTPTSSRAVSRNGPSVVDEQEDSHNTSQADGQDESQNDSHDHSRESGANDSHIDSHIDTVESHHISHNYGGYTDSESDQDDDDSDVNIRGRNRTRNSTRSNSRNVNRSRRSRTNRASRATPNDELDLDYSGYTSRDSLTRDVVVKKDWRVLQVKTRELTSNASTTQYWHWVDERHAHETSGPGDSSDVDPMFEHQVLKETEPTTGWGVFREPINFHLRLRELTGIRYATGSTVIVIGTEEMPDFPHRGDVLARFKRERTKRRFLVFMKKKGVALHKVSRDEIQEEWGVLSSSELMPGNESD